ncbi:putative toxin-antitoxin system toxin component, PIN family [Rhodoferax sp. 4810]|nr:putative toxin-antitoxin system toxin component, PIN family [Rhodoferax jenense]
MTSPIRVVLDTNVVLSALVFGGGQAGQLRLAWQHGAFVPLVSTATAQELVRVLAYPKFRLSKFDQDELLADYLPYAQTVRVPQPPPTVPDCRDPQDVPFLHLAVVGQAQWLVSGDKDLLALAEEFQQTTGCRIVAMDTFLNRQETAR